MTTRLQSSARFFPTPLFIASSMRLTSAGVIDSLIAIVINVIISIRVFNSYQLVTYNSLTFYFKTSGYITMSNTKVVKVSIPIGQYQIIEKWVADGLFTSVTTFCNNSVEKEIERQKDLMVKFSCISIPGRT